MSQDLEQAKAESRQVLELIGKKKLEPDEREKVISDSVKYWTDHVNAGFLQYRKSVSTDYTAVEWEDNGAVFRDINGKEFIDMLGGYGCYNVGHRHPRVIKAVSEQLERQAIHSQELIDPLRTYLAHLVSLITPGDLQYSFFSNSGTESVEGCLKMAMLATGRKHFIGAVGGFHGKTLGSLGSTSKAIFREPFMPLLHWTHVPFGDIEALESVLKCADFSGDRVAAVVLEPVRVKAASMFRPGAICPLPANFVIATGRCWFWTKFRAVWVAPVKCSIASMRVLLPICLLWARLSVVVLCPLVPRLAMLKLGPNILRILSCTPLLLVATLWPAPPPLPLFQFCWKKICRGRLLPKANI